jgi:putative ABC transport system permease protein
VGFVRRALLSIVRRPGKSLILFLVVLIIGTLIAGVVAVRQAVAQSEETAKQLLGANVSLGMDDQAVMDAYSRGEEVELERLGSEVIEELGRRPEVKGFDYSLDAYLPSRTLRNYREPMGGSEEVWTDEAATDDPDGTAGTFTLRGIRHAPVLPIEEGRLDLVEGRVFTEADIVEGRLVVLVPDLLAEQNGIQVGDTLMFFNEIRDFSGAEKSSSGGYGSGAGTVAAAHDVALEVIGVFARNSAAGGQGSLTDSSGSELYGTLYVPIKVAQAEDEFRTEAYRRMAEAAGEEWAQGDYEPYYTPVYLLDSVDDIAGFEQAAAERLPAYYRVLSATSQYEQIAGPMQEIQRIVSVALVAAVAVSLAVVSLTVVLFLRDRRKEFGVYLSLGARRPAIVGQVLAEVLVVAVVALGIALFAGSLVSDGISQQMVDDQMTASQGSGGSSFAGSYLGGDAGLLMGSLTPEDVAAGYRVSFSVPYVLTFLGLGVGVVALSCVVPLLYVLRLKPKRILM